MVFGDIMVDEGRRSIAHTVFSFRINLTVPKPGVNSIFLDNRLACPDSSPVAEMILPRISSVPCRPPPEVEQFLLYRWAKITVMETPAQIHGMLTNLKELFSKADRTFPRRKGLAAFQPADIQEVALRTLISARRQAREIHGLCSPLSALTDSLLM